MLLTGVPDAADDPCGLVLAVHELVRLGELDGAALDDAVAELAAAINVVARRDGWDVDAALAAAAAVLVRAGEARAAGDIARIRAGRDTSTASAAEPASRAGYEPSPPSSGASPPTVRCCLPASPTTWLGQSFEVHGVPVGPASTVSYAVRWHGAHAAVLWQVDGAPVELTAPAVDAAWSST